MNILYAAFGAVQEVDSISIQEGGISWMSVDAVRHKLRGRGISGRLINWVRSDEIDFWPRYTEGSRT